MSSLRSCVVALATVLATAGAAQAAGRAALVVDANTGQDLHVRDADRPLYPASLTKMMTLYIVFDMMEQKRVSGATKIHVTDRCANQPPSNLELPGGSTLTLREAVLALVVKSANDVACAIGENFAGSEDKFAQIMTSKARQIGMRATTFRNASGLPDPAQVTTARDLAALALRLIHDFPEHYKVFGTREFTFNGRTHRSHNGLLHSFEGTDGIKTGYTRASGFNLVSSVRRGHKHVIGVVMGGVTAAQRNATMRALLTQGLGRARSMEKPLLVRRPALVAEASRATIKPPVPRRVSDAGSAERTPAPQPTISEAAGSSVRRRPDVVPASVQPAAVSPKPTRIAATDAAVTAAPPTVRATPASHATAAGLGRPPATFQDQAQEAIPSPALASSAAATAGLKGGRAAGQVGRMAVPAPARTASLGPFQVQIGAFSNAAEAQRQLTAVSERAGAVLTGHAPVTVPTAKSNMQFYRARFAGFNEAKAQAACQSLKAQKIECVVMRAE